MRKAILILLLMNCLNISAKSWPKCPAIDTEPIFIVDIDSTTILLPNTDPTISFEYILSGTKGLIAIERHTGNTLSVPNQKNGSSLISIELRRLCGEVFSRRSVFSTPTPNDIFKIGGYIKKYGECSYVKSILDTSGFVLANWPKHNAPPILITESPLPFLQLTLPLSIQSNNLLIGKLSSKNIFYSIEESDKALEGFQGYLSAESILAIGNIDIHSPQCEEKYGSIDAGYTQIIDQQFYFSIDQGKKWYPDAKFENILPGKYRLLVRVGLESCIYEVNKDFTIEDKDQIDVRSIDVIDGSYCQNLKGSITLDVNKPENLSFYIDGKAKPGPLFDNLSPGEYDIRIVLKSNTSCFVEYKKVIVEDEFLLSNRFMTIKDATACNRNDGEIIIQYKTNNFEFSIDQKTWKTSGVFTNLAPGGYVVRIRTKDGECASASQNVQINAKNGRIPENQKPEINNIDPKCAGGATGEIFVTDRFNAQPHFVWNFLENGVISESTNDAGHHISNLRAGNYRLDHFTTTYCYSSYFIDLVDPPPFAISNPLNAETGILCEGSQVSLSMPEGDNLNYEWWTKGKKISTESSTMLNAPGTYSVIGSNKEACKDTVEFEIKNSELIFNPDFLFPSIGLIHDTLVGVDITLLQPDQIIWHFPSEATKISDGSGKLELSFNALGTFAIIFEAHKGRCKSIIEKQVIITDDASLVVKDNQRAGKTFKKFLIFPNPSDGRFTIEYELSEPLETNIHIYDQLGNKHFSKSVAPTTLHREEAELELLPPGAYVVMVNTSQVVQIGTIVIRK